MVALAVVMLLTIFDDVGWADVVALVINLVPFVLLLIGRKWYMQPKT